MESRTFQDFLLERAKMEGAMHLGLRPSAQGPFQKLAFMPSPMVTFVNEWNSSISSSLHGFSIPTHGLSGEVQASQGQRRRKALPNFSIEDAETSKVGGATNRGPVDLAFTIGGLFGACPKEATDGLGDGL
jgi:hypothetical protein